MRKLFIIGFFLFRNILWGQNLLNQIVYSGDISLLDNLITIYQLRDFSKNDLRILRNTIYAKYGYKFNSKDLQDHFSQFSWYIGTMTDVENELKILDRENIALIQRIETNYPKNNELTNELIGDWYFLVQLLIRVLIKLSHYIEMTAY
ncbi:MAG: YARHG domain-containing protein [Treponema sp.]|jgi:hypothetical protein|nr:YARHG domain-containing protein [Treponema sp.]